MENNNTVINALSQFITSTINSYIQTMSSQKISMEVILKSIMKSYNLFLLKGFPETLKQEVNSKINTKEKWKIN